MTGTGNGGIARCASIALLVMCSISAAGAQELSESSGTFPTHQAPVESAFEDSAGTQFSADRPGLKWSAGAELIVIVPRFESNPALTTTTIQSTGPGAPLLTSRNYEEFRYDYAASPRLWLGAEGQDGIGARVRWWQYQQAAPTLTASNPPIPLGSATLAQTVASQSPLLAIGPQTGLPAVLSLQTQGGSSATDVLKFHTSLTMQVWDFEATLSDLAVGQWLFLMSGGLRYAHLNQTYNASLAGDLAASRPPQFLDSRQSFDGLGPTMAVEVRRPWESLGLTLTGGARLAFLYGSDRHSVTGSNVGLVPSSLTTPPSFILGDDSDSSSRMRSIPVVEMDLGVQRTVPLGKADWLLKAGVLGQLWPIGSGAHANGNMALIGFTAGTGLRF